MTTGAGLMLGVSWELDDVLASTARAPAAEL